MNRKEGILYYRALLDKSDCGKQIFDETIKKIEESQSRINAFVTIMKSYEKCESSSLISGVPYALKDNFSTKGILTTASSNILKDYVPVYDSTVYKKLKNAGSVLTGKTVLDELAMGGSGTTGHTGTVKNPWNTSYLIGGSSAGSTAAVAEGLVPFAIGSDTGDSVRKPASFGGTVGFKPTYGRISRYGLFAFASSLDHVGILSRNVTDAAIVTDILKGYDENDMTSIEESDASYYDSINNSVENKKLFYIKELVDKNNYTDENILKRIDMFMQTVDKIKSLGIEVYEESVDIKLLESVYPCYYSISCAESTSNNSNLTGINFGNKIDGKDYNEIMIHTRTEGFSELIKRRFILGSYILQRENQERLFKNAMRIRRLIVDRFNELFKEYDGYVLPASALIAPKIDESNKIDKLSNEYLLLENHLCIGNFGGYPSITIPEGFMNGMPVGINITCPVYKDGDCLNIAKKIEEVIGLENICAGGDK